jgi:6-phosphogluconolactonase
MIPPKRNLLKNVKRRGKPIKPEIKRTLQYAAVLATLNTTVCLAAVPDSYRVYFGTSAKKDRCGIYLSELDMQTGKFGDVIRVSDAARPGFIDIHPDGKHIYATGGSGTSAWKDSALVSAFKIVEPEGMLTDINTQSSGGEGTCHVSIDPTGKNLLAANYRGGSCAVLPIRSDGSLGSYSSLRQHTGSSIHPKRQTQAYAHSINCDPAGKFAMVADLGIDKIMIYRFDAAAGTLIPNDPPFVKTEEGGGPRHFTFHPAGKFGYTNLEMGNKVTVFEYDSDRGGLTEIQTLSTLPPGFKGENTTSEILTSPDGRFLYVGNRGHNSVAIFSIDAATGKLTALGHESTRGEIPRNFNIDPTGTYLVAANQKTSNVVVFKIDTDTGLLKFTGSEIEVPNPICVRFLAVP